MIEPDRRNLQEDLHLQMAASSVSPQSPSSSRSPNLVMESSALTAADELVVEINLAGAVATDNQTNVDQTYNKDEPPCKKQMLNNAGTSGRHDAARANEKIYKKLETRLEEILCCAVCLDLPKMAIYQCQMGHLMCAACFAHLLADGRLRNKTLTCPNCRVEISKSTVTRNRAVEKIAYELPSQCQNCNFEFPYKVLAHHEKNECSERPTSCKYSRIGCEWNGPFRETENHEAKCTYPLKSGKEVMEFLRVHDAKVDEERKMYQNLIDMLSYENIVFNDLKMEAMRLYVNNSKLTYETNPFTVFDQKWVVKARINSNQREPHQSNDRTLSYQLVLWTDPPTPMNIIFCALKGPFSDLKIAPHIYKHEFVKQFTESGDKTLPLPDNTECNRLLSDEYFNFRLLMVMTNK